MHEEDKIKVVKYFHSRMVGEEKDRNNFVYNLSAFLASARSVMQYALDRRQQNGR